MTFSTCIQLIGYQFAIFAQKRFSRFIKILSFFCVNINKKFFNFLFI